MLENIGGRPIMRYSIEFAFFSICRITATSLDGMSGGEGTGFLICLNHDTPDSRLMLVTNRHVIPEQDMSVNLSLNSRSKDGQIIIGDRAVTNINMSSIKSFYHPEYDLAAIDITSCVWEPSGPYVKFWVPEQFIPSFDELWPGKEVAYLGYPDGRFDEYNNLPLLRQGIISSYPTLDYNNRKLFLIDTHSYRGSSGSPVFTEFNQKLYLVGIFVELLTTKVLAPFGSQMDIEVELPMGLGVVIKSPVIQDFLNLISSATKN
ncbi:S1 family peptidase [Deinococcus koreensis]|uniref:Serine protease n=1 Tax=Deinococcus koreensis TaxID=2054903 RepID=A0A2K3UVF5_9DEIO|nr:serine protease [Deinococcus koreensis]PNY80523.1 hypothetical protein CVO96_03325 [Deinococcus koreensis]